MSDVVTCERERLQHFLDQQRNAVVDIIDGLDQAQLSAPVLPSGWTPIGLVRHLIGAEAMWFQGVVLGTQPQMAWDDGVDDPPYEPGVPFTGLYDLEGLLVTGGGRYGGRGRCLRVVPFPGERCGS